MHPRRQKATRGENHNADHNRMPQMNNAGVALPSRRHAPVNWRSSENLHRQVNLNIGGPWNVTLHVKAVLATVGFGGEERALKERLVDGHSKEGLT